MIITDSMVLGEVIRIPPFGVDLRSWKKPKLWHHPETIERYFHAQAMRKWMASRFKQKGTVLLGAASTMIPPASDDGLSCVVTIAVAPNTYTTTWRGSPYYYDANGYLGVDDYYTWGPIVGSVSDDVVNSFNGTHKLSSVFFGTFGFLVFSLDVANIANEDDTFVETHWGSAPVTRTRASGVTYVASRNSATHWYWSDSRPTGWGTSGTAAFEIHL